MILLTVLVLTSACSEDEEELKGPLSIRLDLDNYEVETVPLEEKIIFELSSEELLNEIEEPEKITTVHQTTLYLEETFQREDSIVVATIGFEYNYKSPEGEMLSLYQMTEEGIFTNSGVVITVLDEDGTELDIAKGSGDGEEYEYEQWVGVQIPNEVLTENDKITIEIDALHILSYRER